MFKTMYYYVLAVFFVSTYSGSLGVPLPVSSHNGSVSALLSSLASSCPNTFIKEQIVAQIKECDIPVSPYGKLQYACIMFLDINKQLCESNSTSIDNSSAKINEYLDVENVCAQAKNWSVTDFKELPGYKDKVEGVLRNIKGCEKICEVEDPFSQDSNFFCKYFKWGSGILSSASAISSVNKEVVLANPNSVGQSSSGLPGSSSVSQVVSELHQDANLPSEVDNSVRVPETSKVSEKLNVEASSSEVMLPKENPNQDPDSLVDVEVPISNKNRVITAQVTDKTGQLSKDQAHEMVIPSQTSKDQTQESGKPGQISLHPVLEPEKPGVITVDHASELEKPGLTVKASQSPQFSGNLLKTPSLSPIVDESSGVQKPPQMGDDGANEDGAGKPPQKDVDTDEYQDSEETQQGVDNIDVQNEPDTDPQPDEPHPITGTSYKGSPSNEEREFYQNSMAEDDHFFPFFLTAVIMVVLLYVLYHNKSKVSKVILGLIVEGRQPGRRRNSRGHAYKRLDTLEQAMSTSSTAPPSKIIY